MDVRINGTYRTFAYLYGIRLYVAATPLPLHAMMWPTPEPSTRFAVVGIPYQHLPAGASENLAALLSLFFRPLTPLFPLPLPNFLPSHRERCGD